jgi:hypothetical protein
MREGGSEDGAESPALDASAHDAGLPSAERADTA